MDNILLEAKLAEIEALRTDHQRLLRESEDETLDGTDGASPAWWRGHDAGAESAARRIEAALDGTDAGQGVRSATLERIRQSALALRVQVVRLDADNRRLKTRNAILERELAWAHQHLDFTDEEASR